MKQKVAFWPKKKATPNKETTMEQRYTDPHDDSPLADMKITVARIVRPRHIRFEKKN